MKAWIISDLHLEFAPWTPPTRLPRADVCVVAGDILTKGGVSTVRWLAENIVPHMQVIAVCGNHEFYGSSLVEGLAAARSEAARHRGLHLLEHDWVEIEDVVFVGATLWTDFELFKTVDPQVAMRHCHEVLTDYSRIAYRKNPFQKLHPLHTRQLHRSAVALLTRFLEFKRARKTVVVTHHAPSARSIPYEFAKDLASSAFASDLEWLMEDMGPTVWVHGHVHQPQAYTIGRTAVVCNPRGYPGEASFQDFDPAFTVEIRPD